MIEEKNPILTQPAPEGNTSSSPKEKGTNAPRGIRRFLQVFDVVGDSNLRNIIISLPYVAFIVLLSSLHIANNHQAESYARLIARSEKEVRDLRWQYMETTNNLMKKSRLSEVSKLVEAQGLKELRQPPYIIETNKSQKK